MGRKFKDSSGADLPVGSHEPCQACCRSRGTSRASEMLTKWPDMKPSLCFRFMLHKPDDPEFHGATGVRFVTDTVTKLGNCSSSCTDFATAMPPDEFDEDDYVGKWYRIVVRKKPKTRQATRFHRRRRSTSRTTSRTIWSETEAIEKARKRAKKRRKKQKKARDEDAGRDRAGRQR